MINLIKIYVEHCSDDTILVAKSEIDGVSNCRRFDVKQLKVAMHQSISRDFSHIDEEAQALCVPGTGQVVFLRWFEMVNDKKVKRYEAFEDEYSGAGYQFYDKSQDKMPNGIPYYAATKKTLNKNVWIAENVFNNTFRLLKIDCSGTYVNRRSIWFHKLLRDAKEVRYYVVEGDQGILVLDRDLRTLYITSISQVHGVITQYPVVLEGDDYDVKASDVGFGIILLNLSTHQAGRSILTSQFCGAGWEGFPYQYNHSDDNIFHSATSRHYMNYMPLSSIDEMSRQIKPTL